MKLQKLTIQLEVPELEEVIDPKQPDFYTLKAEFEKDNKITSVLIRCVAPEHIASAYTICLNRYLEYLDACE